MLSSQSRAIPPFVCMDWGVQDCQPVFFEFRRKNNDMVRFRYLCIILLVALTSHSLKAQDDALKVGLRVGHNVPFGWFEAASLETNHTFGEGFSINGGVQYSTMERIAIEARPTYTMHFPWGRLSAEVLMTYTQLSSINNMAVGGGAWVDYGRMNVTLGYYYRLYGGEEVL